MKLKITVDTDDTADLLALRAIVDHYLSQPCPTSAELIDLMQQKADTAERRMKDAFTERLYGDSNDPGPSVLGLEGVGCIVRTDDDTYYADDEDPPEPAGQHDPLLPTPGKIDPDKPMNYAKIVGDHIARSVTRDWDRYR
jgi:hypothetical protein